MGEMADYNLSQEDYYGDDTYWPTVKEKEAFDGPPIRYYSCKYCGKDNLLWGRFEDKWRLWEGEPNSPFSKVHSCKEHSSSKLQAENN